MPAVTINYEAEEVRALIQKDLKERFGLSVIDDHIDPDFQREGAWTVNIEKGSVDASKAQTE